MEIEPDPLRSLRLPADCSIAGIRDVHDLIRKSLKSQDTLEIDCSGVDRADVTSVQLLISTARTAQLEGRSVNLTALSDVLRDTLTRAGVTDRAVLDDAALQQNGGK
jgi:ABC-type transporter Mla MlaB component